LTPLGQAQAEAAAEAFRGMGLRRILASPYTRALQTAAPASRVLGLPVLVHEAVRERAHFACDIGTPRAALARAWPSHDFAHLEEVWWPRGTEAAETVRARALRFRAEMLADEAWADTLVVSHWAFLITLTGHSLENGAWLRIDLRDPPPPPAFIDPPKPL
jgi:broad specificity phosphatase PhoE